MIVLNLSRKANTKLNKLKSATQNKTGTILRLNKKNFEEEELPHQPLLTTRLQWINVIQK